jgi:hypothetical protein
MRILGLSGNGAAVSPQHVAALICRIRRERVVWPDISFVISMTCHTSTIPDIDYCAKQTKYNCNELSHSPLHYTNNTFIREKYRKYFMQMFDSYRITEQSECRPKIDGKHGL